jgi:thiosulfate reductase cytochrome b subunit
VWHDVISHLRLQVPPARSESPYGVLQKCAYLTVVFVAAPLMAFTGLAMSPAVTAAMPFLLTVFGGYQSARTLHFFSFAALLLFVAVHVAMVILSGFRQQIRAMTVGD